ncbi:MAG: porin family protein [Cytophagales bacterium]|nr:porin family protein [Cytophagales bacterium]
MKPHIACIIVLFAAWVPMKAQIFLGLKGGANLSSQTIDIQNIKYSEKQNIVGINLALQAEYVINTWLSLKTELMYGQKGYKVVKYLNNEFFQNKNLQYHDYWAYSYNYVEMPIMSSFYIASYKLKAYIDIGISPAYLTGGTKSGYFFINQLGYSAIAYVNVDEPLTIDTEYGNDKKKDNRLDMNLLGGFGIDYLTPIGNIKIDFRYSHGTLNMLSYENPEFTKNYPQLNRNMSITIGYFITIKGAKKTKNSAEDEDYENDNEQIPDNE